MKRPNSQRAHDLVDLQLIVSNGDIEFAETKQVCERLFAYRRMQTWPPLVVANDGWDAIYAEAAAGLDVLSSVEEAVVWANRLIDVINSA